MTAIYLCIVVGFAVFSQIMVIKAVKFGIKIAEKPEDAAEQPIFHIPEKKKKPEMTESEYRNAQILGNIDRYNGTSSGQVKVQPQEK